MVDQEPGTLQSMQGHANLDHLMAFCITDGTSSGTVTSTSHEAVLLLTADGCLQTQRH